MGLFSKKKPELEQGFNGSDLEEIVSRLPNNLARVKLIDKLHDNKNTLTSDLYELALKEYLTGIVNISTNKDKKNRLVKLPDSYRSMYFAALTERISNYMNNIKTLEKKDAEEIFSSFLVSREELLPKNTICHEIDVSAINLIQRCGLIEKANKHYEEIISNLVFGLEYEGAAKFSDSVGRKKQAEAYRKASRMINLKNHDFSSSGRLSIPSNGQLSAVQTGYLETPEN